ncbi:FxLYD domain-containing protein [Haloterrigena salifodinae]|uniref:FxLYD domain-containing protein n=1 Tax=Haloterrigena salifodinae TaxID=2675099 RepID=UPI000F87E59D|nr:FxLYD domain-containing protein [Haloterrigena salifodinae]
MQELTRRKAIVGIGGATTALLAGCSGSEDNGDSASSNGDENGDENGNENGGDSGSVEILEHEAVEAEYGDSVNIEGKIQNNTGEEQSYIEVSALFYDSEGTRVGDGMDNFNDVADGSTLSFEIVTTVGSSEYDEYELETSTSI